MVRWAREVALYRADSSGCRNTACVTGLEELVQSLGRCSPAERLSRPAVEGHRHGCKVLGAVRAEVGALWKVLAQQPVGVLVRAALPLISTAPFSSTMTACCSSSHFGGRG